MAFHPYPQLIPQVFNPGGFGPPHRLTGASPWPWVDHSASGLDHATQLALFRLAFATATPHGLTSPRSTNSQAHSSKGTPSPPPHQGRHSSDGLQAHGFRYSFTPLPGYFSSFPHGTRPLSVTRKYLGLPSGPGRFTANSTSSLLLGNTTTPHQHSFRVRDSHPLRSRIPTCSTSHAASCLECQLQEGRSHNPPHTTPDRSHMREV